MVDSVCPDCQRLTSGRCSKHSVVITILSETPTTRQRMLVAEAEAAREREARERAETDRERWHQQFLRKVDERIAADLKVAGLRRERDAALARADVEIRARERAEQTIEAMEQNCDTIADQRDAALARAEKAEAEAEQMREHADHFGIKRVGELRSDLADAVEALRWSLKWIRPEFRHGSQYSDVHAILDRLEEGK